MNNKLTTKIKYRKATNKIIFWPLKPSSLYTIGCLNKNLTPAYKGNLSCICRMWLTCRHISHQQIDNTFNDLDYKKKLHLETQMAIVWVFVNPKALKSAQYRLLSHRNNEKTHIFLKHFTSTIAFLKIS